MSAGFYALAGALLVGLGALVWFDLTQATRPHPKLLLAAGSSFGLLAWSLFPRRDRFHAPGPELDPAQHPELFRLIDSVAQDAGRARPDAVYLIGDVNAWVAERGGWMGLGSHQVMAIGEPLLQVLNRAELRAVLAHEFGHFVGGDTKLGPWIYKTRSALERSIEHMEGTLYHLPFLWYGKLFMRVSLGVSRAQEYAADALSARFCGSTAAIGALRKITRASYCHDQYWDREVVPVLEAGFLPPLTEGFGIYLSQPGVNRWLDRSFERELADDVDDLHDTHPSLPKRLEALEALPPGQPVDEDEPARGLIENLVELERIRLETHNGKVLIDALEPIAWDAVPGQVWVPRWRRRIEASGPLLDGIALSDLADPETLEGRLELVPDDWRESAENDAELLERARWTAAMATVVRLHERGFMISADPGALPLVHHTDGETFDPLEVLEGVANGDLEPAAWTQAVGRFQAESLALVSTSPTAVRAA
ncbi:MAG: M48 family metallopeptidase [Planctomycetota bacterium]